MFYILPFTSDLVEYKYIDLEDFLELVLLTDNNKCIDVIDSKDMVVENVSIRQIKDYIRKGAKFPQLQLRKDELYVKDSYLELTRLGTIAFYDKTFGITVRVRKSRHTNKSYNRYFTKYLNKTHTHLDEDYAEYSGVSFNVSSSAVNKDIKVSIQGIVDNFGQPTCAGLFVNDKFICYIDPVVAFGYDGDEVDFILCQIQSSKVGYLFTFISPNTSQFFMLNTNRLLTSFSLIRLSSVIDDEYYKIYRDELKFLQI